MSRDLGPVTASVYGLPGQRQGFVGGREIKKNRKKRGAQSDEYTHNYDKVKPTNQDQGIKVDNVQMEPFVYCEEYKIILCCRSGRIADELETHLESKHKNIGKNERKRMVREAQAMPGIIQKREELRQFQLPVRIVDANPLLEPPRTDGLQCRDCQYINRRVRHMQDHCRNKHGWVNRQKRGRISRLQAQGCQVPWTTGIHCQRFFKSGHASGWFEVARPAQGQESPAEEEQGFDILAQAEAELEDEPTEDIEKQSQQVEPNRWLNRVGWHVHLQGLDRHQLLQARGALSDDEVELGRICEGVDRMAEAGRDVVLQLTIGNAALFQLNSNTAGSKARKPFHAHVGEDTWARYTEVVKTVFRIILRAEEWPKKERPPYRLTPQQRRRLEEMRQEAGTEQDQDQDELDRAVLEFFIALLDHGYKQARTRARCSARWR